MSEMLSLTREKTREGPCVVPHIEDACRGTRAVFEMGAMREPAVGPLIHNLVHGRCSMRWEIAMKLARIGPPAMESLIDALQIRDPLIRIPVVWAITDIGGPRAVQSLMQILLEEDSETCRALVTAALLKLWDAKGVMAVQNEFEKRGKPFIHQTMNAYSGSWS